MKPHHPSFDGIGELGHAFGEGTAGAHAEQGLDEGITTHGHLSDRLWGVAPAAFRKAGSAGPVRRSEPKRRTLQRRAAMGTEVWVVNASPLITFAKIGRFELLESHNRTLLIPEAVADEVARGGSTDSAKQALARGFGGDSVPVAIAGDVQEWSLGRGESAVPSLAPWTG